MSQKGNIWIIISATIAVIAVAGGAYFYWQNQKLREIAQTPKGVDVTEPALVQTPRSSLLPTSISSTKKATVVYEAEGSFSVLEKNELKKKIIDPFLDYYTTESTEVLLTLTISKNDKANKNEYPYLAKAIFEGGGNMGFVIMKVGDGVDWWYPDCLNGCTLSTSYKAKYPEIASKVQ